MVRLCPVCDEPLWIVELEGIEADCCARCRGIWLDEGELEIVSHLDRHDPLLRVQREGRAGAPSSASFGEPSTATLGAAVVSRDVGAGRRGATKRRCPRCSKRMHEVVLGSEPPVLVDRCPHGHGLWFDRDELRQLLVQFAGAGRAVAHLEQLFGRRADSARPG